MNMKANEQTLQQIDRFFRKVSQKFPATDNAEIMTDIHVCVNQETGEMTAFNDDNEEITRCVVEQWIDNKEDRFFDEITLVLRKHLKGMREIMDNLGILKPYSLVLENEDKEFMAELYVADDETIIIGGDIMSGLDEDLDQFFNTLMKEE